jgi:DNA polymerase-3 subunit alpha
MSFVQIHNHTEWSVLDGLSSVTEAAAKAAADGNPALAQTDHGTNAGCWDHQAACDAVGIKPVFGTEAYFRENRIIRPAPGDREAQTALAYGDHLILLAMDDQGLRDLWEAGSEAHRTGYYHRPRMDWEVLERYGSRLIATSSCLGGIVSQDLLQGREETALRKLLRLKDIFGDRFYLEIQANRLPDQVRLNEMLASAGKYLDIPLVAACDAHYPSESEAALHKLWMLCQTGRAQEGYWNYTPMLAEDQVREVLGYLDRDVVEASIAATTEIADRCNARIGGHFEPPVFTRGGTADDDARALRQMCEANWGKVAGAAAGERAYRDRLDREFEVVAGKGLAGCYLIVDDIVTWVRSQGWLVGPGRGSAAGSLMSYLLGITSTDPLRAGLLFERFLTPGREALPDFDLDFASSKRKAIQDYVTSLYGEDHVIRVGTVMRFGAKGILNKLFSVMAGRLPPDSAADARAIAHMIDEAQMGTAGLGLPWDEIMAEQRIAEFAEKYRTVFSLAAILHGRIYAYGKHPAGLIISPGAPLTGAMPMRLDTGSRMMVGEWGYREAENLGLLKLDLLTLRTLDSLQGAIELVEARTGRRIDPRQWDAEHDDPQVYEEISAGHTPGMFQVETSLCTGYCERMRPASISDLADLTTYVRPGPRNSGAAEAYLRRRAGAEEVDYPHPLLKEALSRSYGLLLYQEDILQACRILGGYSDLEADGVRKILGKKLTDKIAAAGEEFTRRCAERGHDEEQIGKLWTAMAEFGKYAFNRAHGYSYATLSYWTAWMKVHYPVEMITAILSTLDKMDRMAAFATEARRLGITVLPPDVRVSDAGFAAEGLSIRYGLKSIPGVGPAAITSISAGRPYRTLQEFRERSGADAGVTGALAKAGALDPLVTSRRGLVLMLQSDRDGSAARCVHKAPAAKGPGGLPCTFDWASEPQPPPRTGKTGKPLKLIVKPPPRRCTVACRRYSPPEAPALDMPEYSPAELFRMETEIYGTWLTPASFGRLDARQAGLRDQARQMGLAVAAAPPGTYTVAAVYGGHRSRLTRRGSTMWFVTLVTEAASIDVACFSPLRETDPDMPAVIRMIRAGTLVGAEIEKRTWLTPAGVPRTGGTLTDIWEL